MKQVIQIRCKNNKKSQKVEIGSTLFDIFSAFDLKMTHGPVQMKNSKGDLMILRKLFLNRLTVLEKEELDVIISKLIWNPIQKLSVELLGTVRINLS
jgi:hypothetical protein